MGSVRKQLNNEEKEKYAELFEKYFLKSFSSRLAEYTNPEIDVLNKKVLSENYTIVNSLLKATSNRPEVKIDFFSLDVEGDEFEVLEGIDFKKYSFKFILIESKSINKLKIFLKKKKLKN